MRPSRIVAVAIAIALLVAIVFVPVLLGGGEDQEAANEDSVEVAGTRMSRGELRELVRSTMGEDRLEDVPAPSVTSSQRDNAGVVGGGVRRFDLRAQPVRWEYRDGQRVAAWAYDGLVPGPVLRAVEGERVEVTFRNDLPVATTVHWHGVDVPWQQDGVPGLTQEAIEPGDTFTYTFNATPAGTRWYHTHGSEVGDETEQLDMGLSGALVIAPRRGGQVATVDRTLVLDEWNVAAGGYNAAMLGGHAGHAGEDNVFTINGKAAPDVEEIVVREGQRVRLRWVNASSRSYHPMHVHGHQFRIVALDGNPVPSPVVRNVVLLAPGETADIEFIADNPGAWAVHCHDLHHADAGMTMLLRYEGIEPVGDGHGGTGGVAGPVEEAGTGAQQPKGAPPARKQPKRAQPPGGGHVDGDDHG